MSSKKGIDRNKARELRSRAEAVKENTFRDFWTLVVECASILREIAPNRRRPWLAKVITEVYEKQDGLCALCGRPLESGEYHVDHVIPFCYGGGNERTNLQLAHPECNLEKKAAVDPYDLLRYLEDRYMNIVPK